MSDICGGLEAWRKNVEKLIFDPQRSNWDIKANLKLVIDWSDFCHLSVVWLLGGKMEVHRWTKYDFDKKEQKFLLVIKQFNLI